MSPWPIQLNCTHQCLSVFLPPTLFQSLQAEILKLFSPVSRLPFPFTVYEASHTLHSSMLNEYPPEQRKLNSLLPKLWWVLMTYRD
ncbi:hypothetical protein SADUNF_Sadunf06G0032000 [Salix dunnii]|uniref:Uncharacterized protein n=1 Tax=Salix dunnii TaxID=1413687 RepID=A0A835K727_9ROSI|nr:hypothetical protein SADUNF_Sadunf06G0032000 [Salix dunnii]